MSQTKLKESRSFEERQWLLSSKHVSQFVFCPFQDALLSLRKVFAGAVDVEIQHRHRRLVWRAFAPFALLSRAF